MTPVQVAAVDCLSVRQSEYFDARNNSRNSFQIDKKALELCAGGKDSYQAPFALEVHNFIVASSAFVFSDINNFALRRVLVGAPIRCERVSLITRCFYAEGSRGAEREQTSSKHTLFPAISLVTNNCVINFIIFHISDTAKAPQ